MPRYLIPFDAKWSQTGAVCFPGTHSPLSIMMSPAWIYFNSSSADWCWISWKYRPPNNLGGICNIVTNSWILTVVLNDYLSFILSIKPKLFRQLQSSIPNRQFMPIRQGLSATDNLFPKPTIPTSILQTNASRLSFLIKSDCFFGPSSVSAYVEIDLESDPSLSCHKFPKELWVRRIC